MFFFDWWRMMLYWRKCLNIPMSWGNNLKKKMAHMFLILTYVYNFQHPFFAANCVMSCPRIYIYIHIVTFTTAATHKLWNSTLSCHAVTQGLVHAHTRPPCTCTKHKLHRVSSSADQLSSTSSPPRIPASFLICSCPLFFLPAAPVSPIKDEQLYNNSRHDSLTLTLHIMKLEVLGKPLMWESQVWTLGASPGNTMVPKRNKVCLS